MALVILVLPAVRRAPRESILFGLLVAHRLTALSFLSRSCTSISPPYYYQVSIFPTTNPSGMRDSPYALINSACKCRNNTRCVHFSSRRANQPLYIHCEHAQSARPQHCGHVINLIPQVLSIVSSLVSSRHKFATWVIGSVAFLPVLGLVHQCLRFSEFPSAGKRFRRSIFRCEAGALNS